MVEHDSLKLVCSIAKNYVGILTFKSLATDKHGVKTEIDLLLPPRESLQPSCELTWTGVATRGEISRFIESLEASHKSLQGTAELCINDYGPFALVLFTPSDGIGHYVIGGRFEQGYSADEQCEDAGRLSAFRDVNGTAVCIFDGLVVDQSYLPQVSRFFLGVLQELDES